jgi:pSer/pThr/pTyr-binding forkhead associated (FHA) protein
MRYRVRAEARTALLGEGELVIGRSSYCSLILEHGSVSRIHAVLRVVGADGTEIEIEDLGSSNGTFVNGQRLTGPTRVALGADVKIGAQLLAIEEAPPREAFKTGRRAIEGAAETNVDTVVVKAT